MADEKAQFTEVLEIDVQVDKFTQNLNTMLDQFDKAMTALEARASKTNINPLAGVNAGASSADVERAIKSIEATMDKFVQHQNKIFADLTNTIVESMDEASDGSKKAGEKQTKDHQEQSDKRKKISKDEADEEVKIVESRAERIKRVTDEILASNAKQTPLNSLAKGEQAEILNNLLTAKKAGEFNAETNLSAPNSKFFDDYQQKLLEQETTHSKVADAITEKDRRETDARLQAATNLGNALDKLSEKRQVNETKASDVVAEKDRRETDARLQAATNLGNALDKLVEKRQDKEAKASDAVAEKDKRETEARLQAASNLKATLDKIGERDANKEAKSHLDDIKAEAKHEEARQEALRQEDLKGINARSSVAQKFSEFLDGLAEKNRKKAKEKEEEKTADLQKEIDKRNAAQKKYYEEYAKGTGYTSGQALLGSNEKGYSGPGGGPKDFVPPNVNGIAPAIKKTREEIEAAHQSSKGFIATLTRDIPGLIGNVIRFGIAWKAFNAIINAVVGIPTLFFSEFREGLKYLEQIQDRTANIKETLLQNVIYSKDYAENINKAGQAAAFATQQVQQVAARFALEPAKLEAAFKGFIQSGGLKLVNNDLERGVELSAKLISVLRSRGIQDTNQRRIVSEIYDLMSGQEKKASVLLSTLNLTVPAWEKLRKEAEKHHNVEQLIEVALDASTDRLKGAGDRYDDLLHTVTLYKEQVLGAFASPIFAGLISVLQKLKKYFEDNKDIIFQTALAWGIMLERAINGVKELGSQNLEALLGAFRAIAGMVLVTAGGLAAMVNALGALVKVAEYAKDSEDAGFKVAAIKAKHFGFDAKSHEGEDAEIAAVFAEQEKRRKELSDALAQNAKQGDAIRQGTQQSVDLLYNRGGGAVAIINQQRDVELAAKKAAIEKEVSEEKITREKATKELADFQVQLDLKYQTTVTAQGQQVAKLKAQIAEIDKQIEAKKEEQSKAKTEAESQKSLSELAVLKAERDKRQAEKSAIETPKVIGNIDKTRPAENELPLLEKDFRKELDLTKQKYDELRNTTNEAVADRTKSHRDAAVEIKQDYADEQVAIDRLIDKYKHLFETSNAKPESIKEAKAGLDALRIELETAAKKGDSAAQKAANKEEVAVAQEQSAAMLRIQKAQAQAELAVTQTKLQQGLVSETQAFNQRVAINERLHQLNVFEIEAEIARNAKGTVANQQAQDKLLEENQRYTNESEQFSLQRQATIDAEAAKRRQLSIESARLDSEELAIEQDFANKHAIQTAIVVANNDKLLKSRQREIELAIEDARAKLAAAKAAGAEAKAILDLEQKLRALDIQRKQNLGAQVENQGTGTQDKAFSRIGETNELQKQVDQAQKNFKDASDALDAFKAAVADGTQKTQFDVGIQAKLQEQVDKTREEFERLNGELDQTKPSFANFGKALEGLLLGNDFAQKWADAGDDLVAKTAAIAGGVGNAIGAISDVINSYEKGRKQGGVIGGIGAVLQGPVGDALSAIPVVGAFVKPLGQVFSFIGGLFTRTAKKIAEEVKAAMADTLKSFNNGDLSLKDTIAKLEQERQDAITRLSGQKGGKDQLNQLLPGFDDQIASLKKQAKDVKETFEKTFAQMELHSDDLARVLATWQDINKQVKDYIGAGGDAAKAAKFISDNLQKIREDAVNTLNEGEQSAIQDAIQLNDLLKQRVDLVKQFKQQEFDLINADAVERRLPGAVSRGRQLADLRAQNAEQLKDLDEQISLATSKVALERQVFDISTDINALHRRDDELTLLALQQQIDKWKNIQQIIAGITQGTNGLFGITPGSPLANALGIAPTPVAPAPTTKTYVPRKPLNDDDPYSYGGRQFRALAAGGIVDEEQLVHVAEGDKPEAVVPLSGGRSIPVSFDWGALIRAISSASKVQQPAIDLSALSNIPRGIVTSIGAIQVTVHGHKTDNPQKLANTIADEIARRARYGYKG